MKKILGLIAIVALTSCGVSAPASRPTQKASTRPANVERTTTTTTTATQQTTDTGTSKADGSTSKGRKVVKK